MLADFSFCDDCHRCSVEAAPALTTHANLPGSSGPQPGPPSEANRPYGADKPANRCSSSPISSVRGPAASIATVSQYATASAAALLMLTLLASHAQSYLAAFKNMSWDKHMIL
jgi:hypothetical protein